MTTQCICVIGCVSHCLDIHAECSKASSALPIFFLHRSMCFLNWAIASRGVFITVLLILIPEGREAGGGLKRYGVYCLRMEG